MWISAIDAPRSEGERGGNAGGAEFDVLMFNIWVYWKRRRLKWEFSDGGILAWVA